MGCNSHLSIEIQGRWSHSPSQWETWALDIPESRDYYLYEAMAGVRGEDYNALVTPRDIPADVSRDVKFWVERAGGDGHSHSWLYPSEFSKALKMSDDRYAKHVKESKYPADSGGTNKAWLSLDKVLNGLAEVYGDKNVRLVFFFDN